MSADAAAMLQVPANRMRALLALLPLPMLLVVAQRYDLGANIRIDYRWLVASVFVLFGALAACAQKATNRVLIDPSEESLLAGVLAANGYAMQARDDVREAWVSPAGSTCNNPLLQRRWRR